MFHIPPLIPHRRPSHDASLAHPFHVGPSTRRRDHARRTNARAERQRDQGRGAHERAPAHHQRAPSSSPPTKRRGSRSTSRPNGQTIVFDILGDLYTIPIAGGKATRITSGMGWDQQPRYSPDGSQIVFVSDRNGAKNVWIANADGTKPHTITKSERINFSSPIWSADGQYVIASRAGQLWMYHKDGGSGLQMTGLRPDGAPATGPAPTAAAPRRRAGRRPALLCG